VKTGKKSVKTGKHGGRGKITRGTAQGFDERHASGKRNGKRIRSQNMAKKLRGDYSESKDSSTLLNSWESAQVNHFATHHVQDRSSRLGNMVAADAEPLTLDEPTTSAPPPSFFLALPEGIQNEMFSFMLERKTDTGIGSEFEERFEVSQEHSQEFISWFTSTPRHQAIPGELLFNHVYELYQTEHRLELPRTDEEFRTVIIHLAQICGYEDLTREFDRIRRSSNSRDALSEVLLEGLTMYTTQQKHLSKAKTKKAPDSPPDAPKFMDSADFNVLVSNLKDKEKDPLEIINSLTGDFGWVVEVKSKKASRRRKFVISTDYRILFSKLQNFLPLHFVVVKAIKDQMVCKLTGREPRKRSEKSAVEVVDLRAQRREEEEERKALLLSEESVEPGFQEVGGGEAAHGEFFDGPGFVMQPEGEAEAIFLELKIVEKEEEYVGEGAVQEVPSEKVSENEPSPQSSPGVSPPGSSFPVLIDPSADAPPDILQNANERKQSPIIAAQERIEPERQRASSQRIEPERQRTSSPRIGRGRGRGARGRRKRSHSPHSSSIQRQSPMHSVSVENRESLSKLSYQNSSSPAQSLSASSPRNSSKRKMSDSILHRYRRVLQNGKKIKKCIVDEILKPDDLTDYFLVCVRSQSTVIVRDVADPGWAKQELLQRSSELDRHFDVLQLTDDNVKDFPDERMLEIRSDGRPDFRILKEELPRFLSQCRVDYEYNNPDELVRLDRDLQRCGLEGREIVCRTRDYSRHCITNEHRLVKIPRDHVQFHQRCARYYGIFAVWPEFGELYCDDQQRDSTRSRGSHGHDRRRMDERRSFPPRHTSSSQTPNRASEKPSRGRGRGRGRQRGAGTGRSRARGRRQTPV